MAVGESEAVSMRVLLNTKPSLLSNKTGVGCYVLNLYKELLKSGIEVVPTLDTRAGALVCSLSKASSRLREYLGKWYPSSVSKVGDALVSRLSLRREDRSRFDIYHETSVDRLPEMHVRRIRTIYDLSFVSCPEFLTESFAMNAARNITKNISAVERNGA